MRLSLFLLGPFLAKLEHDRAVDLTSRKAQALLAYLATEGARTHYREALAGMLWPDHPDRAARTSLRQALQDVRRAIGDDTAATPVLLVSRETIQLSPEADYWLDVAAFEQATAASSRQFPSVPSATESEALRSAIALYQGPFLEGFSLGDSPAFEEWLLLKREHLNRQMLLVLNSLAVSYEGCHAYGDALACVRRIIELEPWQEESHEQAMRLLVLTGRRGEALNQYRRCQDLLLRELGVEPGSEITALYERIRDGIAVGEPSSSPMAVQGGGTLLRQLVSPVDVAPPPPVAREQELARLGGFLSQALAGEGRVVLVTGEAGSGKTMLVEEFGRQAMAEHGDLLVTIGHCSPHSGAGDAYQPFREILHMLTGEPDDVLNSAHARRMQAALPVIFEALVQQGPDLTRLLAHDFSLVDRARACTPRGATWLARLEALVGQADGPQATGLPQAALCEQAARVLRSVARRQPLLLILDDLQWADAPSLDMLFYLGRHLQRSRILILAAFRPDELDLPSATGQPPIANIADEFQRQWGDIRVDLAHAEGREFVDAYLDSWPNRLNTRFRDTLARHTGGNALFVVELVRSLQERGNLLRDGQGRWIDGPSLSWEQLPPRIEGAISQRIRQLTPAQQEQLEAASVEGEEFHAEVLARVRGLSTEAVVASLSGPLGRQTHLVTPGDLVMGGGRPLARYRFRHGLFQSYLYERLDAAGRAHLHGAVGAALEELYGEQASQHAGQLARHFEAAGQADKAASYLLKAGQRVGRIGAYREAATCYERALGLLADQPASTERTELEFALQMALDEALSYALGLGASERLRPFLRAYELAQQMSWSTPSMLRALTGLGLVHAFRGEYERAHHLGQELLLAAERAQSPLDVTFAHITLALCYVWQGNLSPAWEHASQALAFYRNPPHKLSEDEIQALYPQAEFTVALVLSLRGNLDQAREHTERITSCVDRHSPPMLALDYGMTAAIYVFLHEDRLAQEQAMKLLQISESKDMPKMQAMGEAILGWVDARDGQFRQGIERLTAALSVQPERTVLWLRLLQLTLLVEASLAGGETGAARRTVEEILSQAEQTGTHYYDAELWRLWGEIALRGEEATPDGAAQEAKTCFQRAIETARCQGARLWELRATVSLARLWAQQGRSGEAREALTAVYATFSEGFNTLDLVEARTLLDSLGGQVGRSG